MAYVKQYNNSYLAMILMMVMVMVMVMVMILIRGNMSRQQRRCRCRLHLPWRGISPYLSRFEGDLRSFFIAKEQIDSEDGFSHSLPFLQIQPKQSALEAYLESCGVLVLTSPHLLTLMTTDTCESSFSLYWIKTINHQDTQSYRLAKSVKNSTSAVFHPKNYHKKRVNPSIFQYGTKQHNWTFK